MTFMQSAGGGLIIIIYSRKVGRVVQGSSLQFQNKKRKKENNNEKLGKGIQFSINNHFVF